MKKNGLLRVAMTTFGYLYRATLESSLESIARAGYRSVEIAVVPPHLSVATLDRSTTRRLKRLMEDQGLECVSVNPVELNLISSNPEIRELALRHYRCSIELAHELGARVVVVVAGRQSPLIPMPDVEARRLALEQVSRLAVDARGSGSQLGVETVPFGFTETAAEVAALVDEVDDETVGIALDVANTFGREDVDAGVEAAGASLLIAHLSDTWTNRWAHTSIGRGEVDFPRYLAALKRIGFEGPSVYELVDGEDPDARIASDLTALQSWGWSA